jgi:hypothetical protein
VNTPRSSGSQRRLVAWVLCSVLAASAAAADADRSPTWVSLNAAQKAALAPLQRDWAAIDTSRKQKWLEVAARFPAMPAAERQRVQERMAEWARMTPAERGRARLQFQEARELTAEDRQARWQAYQALPEEERRELLMRSRPNTEPVAGGKPAATADAGKRNLMQPSGKSPTGAVAPTVMSAKPGATTTLMSTRAAPPAHYQPGLPKIAATPGFVDSATLLPKRGPQGAAVPDAASQDPSRQP